MAEKAAAQGPPGPSQGAGGGVVAKLGQDVAKAAIPLLVTGAGFLGFVAFVGGAVTWARYSTINVPAEQAVGAMPKGKLVASGAGSLTGYALLGLLAVVVTYLISKEGRPTKRMLYGLLLLVVVESAGVLALAADHTTTRSTAWSAGILIGVVALTSVVIETLGSQAVGPGDWWKSRGQDIKRWVAKALGDHDMLLKWIAAIAWWPGPPPGRVPRILLIPFRPFYLVGWALLALLLWALKTAWPPIKEVAKWMVTIPPSAAPAGQDREEFRLRPLGKLLCAILAGVLGVSTGLLTDQWWVAVSLPLAGLLSFGALRVAHVTGGRFAWYGVAVFFSVACFGTVVGTLRAFDEPQVQPAALIRKSDGPGEGIQGLYVTETSDRVYLASVARQTCDGNKLRGDSGRLFWVRRDQVVSYSVGPLQNADSAARRAPQMLEDLIATRPAQKPGKKQEPPPQQSQAAREKQAARPISISPAVRGEPHIASVTPKMARAGDEVTILGSGFGKMQGTVTVGGLTAEVQKWEAGVSETKGQRDKIVFVVPERATTGTVAVNCGGDRHRRILTIRAD